MLRPRETRELRLTAFELMTAPQASVSWVHDVWRNTVATAAFEAMGDTVAIDRVSLIDLDAVAWPVFDISASAIVYPFRCSDHERADLGALTMLQYPDPDGRLGDWARGFVHGTTTDTLALLTDPGAGVADAILYQSRDEEGTQSPIATLNRGWGSCRDLAVLFAEAPRSLGFGARIVSGYLSAPVPGTVGAGATHAWAEVFVPGAGWITFDTTNRSVGGANLIPVAVERDSSAGPLSVRGCHAAATMQDPGQGRAK